MVPVEIAGLEVRYANLGPADGERYSPNFKKPREDHKRCVARQVNKEYALPT